MINFAIVEKKETSRGSNCFKLLVETSKDTWEEATYFGNTVPKQITSFKRVKDHLVVEIQKHTSRDKSTGRFKCARKAL